MARSARDADYADVFICSDDSADWHSYCYISPNPINQNAAYYTLNRTGIEQQVPQLFLVERKATSPLCHVFCIISGRGILHYHGRDWDLHENQVVLLASGEAHAYESDPHFPLGLLWMEFCGADSRELMQRIIANQSPVIEGMIFSDVCAALSDIHQKIMANERYCPAVEIYHLLFLLLRNGEKDRSLDLDEDTSNNLARIVAYIDAHLSGEITNGLLAALCGVSVQYFSQKFKLRYGMTPQNYIMARRIHKSRYLLTQSTMPIESIAELLGFSNVSHFIRRFKQSEHITPAVYRKSYKLY